MMISKPSLKLLFVCASILMVLLILRIAIYEGIQNLCAQPDDPIRNLGRIDAEFPSPRCCSDASCLALDRGKYAVLTTLRSDAYLPLLRNLACSLRQSNPNVELIVATVRGDLLESTEQDVVKFGAKLIYWDNFQISNRRSARFSLNWVKIRAWEMTSYDVILMIDSDTVVIENIEHLFKLPSHFAAALDEDKERYQYVSLGRMQGGVILLRPCASVAGHMFSLLAKHQHLHFDHAHAEQNFFDWYFRYERWILPVKYNSIIRPYNKLATRGGTNAAIVHFTSKKPFRLNATEDLSHQFASCIF